MMSQISRGLMDELETKEDIEGINISTAEFRGDQPGD